MSAFAIKQELGDYVSVYFNIEADEVMAIGEEMQRINEQAYMNGYNWEAFINAWLEINEPELLKGLETDSEAGTYVALYDRSIGVKADRLTNIINALVVDPGAIYSFLEENGEEVEWD